MKNQFDTEETASILFPAEEELNKTLSQKVSDKIRQAALAAEVKGLGKINPELFELANERLIYDDLAEFIREHVKSVGQEQAVKDFQCGLNFLHKDISDLIKEDGECLGLLAVQNFVLHYKIAMQF